MHKLKINKVQIRLIQMKLIRKSSENETLFLWFLLLDSKDVNSCSMVSSWGHRAGQLRAWSNVSAIAKMGFQQQKRSLSNVQL